MTKTFHIDTSPSKTLVVVPAVFLAIAVLCVIARFHGRLQRKQELLWDDWLCALGLFLSFGCYASIVICVVYGGLGRTIFSLEPGNVPTVFKALTSVSILWATTVAVVQMAILSLYIRIFKVIPWHRYICYAAMGVVFCWWASTFVTFVLLIAAIRIITNWHSMLTTCIPLERFWNPMVAGKCIKLKQFCIASGLLHVFLDAFILSFPLPIIWKLKTTTGNKITVTVACLLGLFATIGGLLRMDCLIPILDYDESDFTESAWIAVLFQILENTCGVICSCAPMLANYVTVLGNTTMATSIRRFIVSNLSRISQTSGGSGDSRRSGRSARSAARPPTIGSWKVNQIKKGSTFGVSTFSADGGSQEHLAEPSQSHVEYTGGSAEFEMNELSKQNSRNEV